MSRNSETKEAFFGSAWGQNSASCFVVVDWAGRPSSCLFNLSDYKGNRSDYPPEMREEMEILRAKAFEEAENNREYYIENMRQGNLPGWLRHAVSVHIGPFGHHIYYDELPNESSTLSGYGLTDAEIAEAVSAGVPVVDTRTVNSRFSVVSLPMDSGRFDERDVDKGPNRGSLSRCSRHFYFKCALAMGATIYNMPPETVVGERLVNNELHNALWGAYVKGDEVAVGQLMLQF